MPADSSPTVDDLKRLIISSLGLEGLTPEAIDDDLPLFGEGLGLDSVDALEIIVALEKRLGIKVGSHQIEPADFATVGSIHRFIEKQRARAAGPPG
ncbi:MAG TPA: phosphopantetheine-binding protein [Candidatus Polarisedimenticolaceae bacterium]|nr:phosphopantetheine-binding protein [Candidatus Polarisedimenticolaceae bacterium]